MPHPLWCSRVRILIFDSIPKSGQLYLNWHFDHLYPRTPPATVLMESVAMIVQEPLAFNRPINPRANTAPVVTARRRRSQVAGGITGGKFRPLFSYAYELLFPQLLSFHSHLRCPIVFSVFDFQLSAVNRYIRPKPSIFSKLQTLGRFQETQLLCRQANTNSFAKTPGVGVCSAGSQLNICIGVE